MRSFDIISALDTNPETLQPGVFLLNMLSFADAWFFQRGFCPALPVETWHEVYSYILSFRTEHKYVAVIQVASDDPDTLLFRGVDLPRDHRHFKGQKDVSMYERFLRDMSRDDSGNIVLEKLPKAYCISRALIESWNKLYEIVSTPTPAASASSHQHAILCTRLDVPDVIARVFDGKCNFCGGGERFICPGCTRGRADEFDVFMGCGVDLACPLCLGPGLAYGDKELLQRYYHETMPKDIETERRNAWDRRMEELGYPRIVWPAFQVERRRLTTTNTTS